MKTLPCDIKNNHNPIKFNKQQTKILISLPEIEIDKEFSSKQIYSQKIDSSISVLKKSLPLKYRKISNVFLIFFDKSIPRSKLLFVLITEIILPISMGSIISILFLLLQNSSLNGECALDNFYSYVYASMKSTFFTIFYYILFGYYVLFPPILIRIPHYQIYIKIFIFFYASITSITLKMLKLLKILPWNIELDVHILNIISGFVVAHILIKKFKISFKEIKAYFYVSWILVILLILHYYVIKAYCVTQLFNICSKIIYGNYLFQIFLFIYFQIYGKIIYILMIKFFTISDIQIKKLNNSVLVFLKYFICDVICSCISIPILNDLFSIEALFGLLNFIFQLITFYNQKNYILNFVTKLFFFIFNKKFDKYKSNKIEKKCKSIIAGSTNEIMIIIFCKILIIMIFRRFLCPIAASRNVKLVIDCTLLINPNIQIKIENFISLILINFFIFTYLIFHMIDKNKIKITWKIESFNPFLKTYFIVLLHFVLDINIQFYFNLYILQ